MTEARRVFVISPIGEPGSSERRAADQVLQHVIKRALPEPHYLVQRADESPNPGEITSRIIRAILNADLIVIDLSGHNPNVFYEAAVAHSFGIPAVHMQRVGDSRAFDLKDVNTITYDVSDPDSVAEAAKAVEASAKFAFENPLEVETPVSALKTSAPRARDPRSDSTEGPDWAQLRDERLLDGALYVKDLKRYVNNPELARTKIGEAITGGHVIPSRYHYTTDVLADRWIDRCREPEYHHQRNTLNFWNGTQGELFAAKVRDLLGVSKHFDYVSLGPGDGEKDAVLVQHWLRSGVDLIYYPYDVSYPLTVRSKTRVEAAVGRRHGVRIKAVLADFHDLETVAAVFDHRGAPNVIGLLGTLGNLEGEIWLLRRLRAIMDKEDLLLLEVRLQSGAEPEDLSGGSSLQHDFGPLEQYFGMRSADGVVKVDWAKRRVSDIPDTRTMLTTYTGPVPDISESIEVKLQYIHLYNAASFRKAIQKAEFKIEHEYAAHDADPPFLELVLRAIK